MTTLIDTFGATLPIFVLGITELVAIFYIYGLERLCIDIEFMTKRKVSHYWRICWFLLAPPSMTFVFIYSTIKMEAITYAGLSFPSSYVTAGWCLLWFIIAQVPLWFCWYYYKNIKTEHNYWNAFRKTFSNTKRWGPHDDNNKLEWLKYSEEMKQINRNSANAANHSTFRRKFNSAFGKY